MKTAPAGSPQSPEALDHEGTNFMAKTSLAPPAPETTEAGDLEHVGAIATKVLEKIETPPAYVLRGLGLFELHGDEILDAYQGSGRWLVPSGTEAGKVYEVRVSPMRPSRDRCECTGYLHHHHCSHHTAAKRVASKRAVCDSCGDRRWRSEIVEVFEEDGLLAWLPGDRICRSCIKAGAWV